MQGAVLSPPSFCVAPVEELTRQWLRTWLRTGPDEVPPEKRARLRLLINHRRYVALGATTCTREEWLAMPLRGRHDVALKAIAMAYVKGMQAATNGRPSLSRLLFPDGTLLGWAARK